MASNSDEPSLDDAAERFQLLSLSIPAETTKYTFIRLFLTRVLNLKDETLITQPRDKIQLRNLGVLNAPSNIKQGSTGHEKHGKRRGLPEVLPGIALAPDLWLRDEVTIKDIKIKVALLNEITSMIGNELDIAQQTGKSDVTINEGTLAYYQKLLVAYKFLEVPKRDSFNSNYALNNIDLSLREEEEETEETDDFNADDSKLIARTTSNQSSTASQKTFHSFGNPFSSNGTSSGTTPTQSHATPQGNSAAAAQISTVAHTSNNKRVSALTASKKRFLTLLGHNGTQEVSPLEKLNGSTSLPSPISEDDGKKQQALNNLLVKSRLYSKIRKHRELASSMSSNISNPSNLSYSNRNSVSTTNSTNSASSRRRISSTLASPDTSDSRMSTQVSLYAPAFPSLTVSQIQENKRTKLEYYNLLAKVSTLATTMLAIISEREGGHNLMKVMDFIKNFVFKFIIIDVSQMIIDYGYFKAHDFSKV